MKRHLPSSALPSSQLSELMQQRFPRCDKVRLSESVHSLAVKPRQDVMIQKDPQKIKKRSDKTVATT